MVNLEAYSSTIEELVETVEEEWEDESIQSNNWEYRYDLEKAKRLFPQHLIIDQTMYVLLSDGLCGIDFQQEENNFLEDVDLFGSDDIHRVTKEEVQGKIDRKQKEIETLEGVQNLC